MTLDEASSTGRLSFWRERLGDQLPILDLPVDGRRSRAASTSGTTSHTVPMDAQLTAAFATLAAEHGVLPSTVLLAVFDVLLHRYSGAEEVLVGVAAGRGEVDFAPVCTDVSDDLPFAAFVARVDADRREALDHAVLPIATLVERLGFTDVLCGRALQAALVEDPGPGGASSDAACHDIELRVRDRPIGIVAEIVFDQALFHPDMARRMTEHFGVLLRNITASPNTNLSHLAMLSEAERNELLDVWGDSSATYGTDCLHRIFEKQVARCPRAVAAVFEGESLTYDELNRRANQLAHLLRVRGVGKGDLVGLSMDRGLELLVGILGILKAGAGYVPLDLANPLERIALILQDTAVRWLVTMEDQLEKLPEHRADCVCLDRDSDQLATHSESDPTVLTTVDDVAYVIYTSGSTGKPKGVVIEHGSVARLFTATDAWFGFSESDVWPLLHSFAFDFSVWEVWGALLYGGRVVVVPHAVIRSPAELLEVLRRERVTVLNQTPSAFRQLVQVDEQSEADTPLSLRLVIFGGEALDPQILRPWFDRHGDEMPRLVNMYGITETTVHVTYHPLRSRDLDGATGSVIGRPIPDVRVYVLDENGQPAPYGVPGEMYVGGAGVGRGYLHRDDLTAERFLPDPFRGADAGRLYKTGDVARLLPSGDIEYLGRNDHQVQIRGFRVELGEIEAALTSHPSIRESVVIAEGGGDRVTTRLVGYVVPASPAPSKTAIREYLRERLPDYMVPATLVLLDALPLTTNGKIDRRALPAPDRELDVEYVPPRNRLETELVELWKRTLDLERIGVFDSFLEIGGDSLLGAQLAYELQERLGETVYVSAIFEAPTVAQLAEYLQQHYADATSRLLGEGNPAVETKRTELDTPIGEAELAEMQGRIDSLAPLTPEQQASPRNPRAVFILSPTRSGSTLFRIMLAGNPQLFAPPELDLLSFNTMRERKAKCVGRYAYMLEGLLLTLAELNGCDAETAQRIVTDLEEQDLTIRELYAHIQGLLGGERLLVEKSTIYGHDPATLQRIEEDFEDPFYLHLARHPCGVIRSVQETRMDRVLRFDTAFSLRQFAELEWTLQQRNILRFLEDVPADRQLRVGYEALLRDPEQTLTVVCRALGVVYNEDMADPYRHEERRMTGGFHASSRVLGDYKFAQHRKLDPSVADRWRGHIEPTSLGNPTRAIARQLGYDDVPPPASSTSRPLSYTQQRLWFLDQAGVDTAYNVVKCLRLRGPLDVVLMERALAGVVERHEVLRTTFRMEDGEPRQIVSPSTPTSPRVEDLRELPEDAREDRARRIADEGADEPFDLAAGPVFRLTLIRLQDDEWILVFVVHHIVFDAHSMEVFFGELSAYYRALATGDELELPALPVSYGEYSRLQRERTFEEVLDRQLAFWCEQLGGGLPALDLPTDRPRPPLQTYAGGAIPVAVDAALTDALKRLASSRDVTLIMLLQAAFSVLLSRYARQDDFAVGLGVANRSRAEIRNLIGFFVNTVVLRADVADDPTFAQLLGRVKPALLAAIDNQEAPFERIVRELQPERDPSRNPIFQVFFAGNEASVPPLQLPGVTVTEFLLENVASHFDLELQIGPAGDALGGRLIFNTDLFDRATAERMLAHYVNLLRAVADDDSCSVSRVPLLDEAQRDQLLHRDDDTAREYPRNRCVHQLVAEQAARNPGACAVRDSDGVSTYAELAQRAASIASELRRLGAGRGVRVGISVERGRAMLEGLLGILGAGAAYVPLDPALPRGRLEHMLGDSGATMLVTDADTEQHFAWYEGRIVRIGDVANSGEAAPLESSSEVGAADPAYVIYTSGSTGVPKGVEIPHQALVNFLTSMLREPGLVADDVLLAVTTLSFDIAGLELFLPLCAGACVDIASREDASDGARLRARLEAGDISVMQATPATWQTLIHAGWQGDGRLKMLCGGEELPRRLADELQLRGGELWNMFGPTETTIWSAVCRVQAGHGPVPLGAPIANTRLDVLDKHLAPVPPGVAGELHIGGDGLALGYVNLPELTAGRFVPSPSPDVPGHLYKTGDLVRRNADGELRFLGRMDHQVKLRGFRIELGEIEASLVQHPSVRQAVVILREDVPGDRRLVAYVTPGGEQQPSAEDLRDALRSRLPEYMLPNAFVVLDELPLSPAGKVDRQALPVPDGTRDITQEYVAPRDELEAILADTWRDVLGVDVVGIHDNFFALGGHSLLLAQVRARLEDSLQRTVPNEPLFRSPTVAALADHLRSPPQDGGDAGMDPLVPVDRSAALPLSFSQQRLWFLDRFGTGSAYNMVFAFRYVGPMSPDALHKAFVHLAQRHEVLRTSFEEVEGRPVQLISEESGVVLTRVDLVGRPDPTAEVDRLMIEEHEHVFDLSRGPLLRATLARFSDQEHVLVVNMHHIVSDGQSMDVFREDVKELYTSFAAGSAPSLPSLSVQYADFAAWQRRNMQSAAMSAQLAYWKERLAGAETLDLPTDRPRPPQQTFPGATVRVLLSPELCAAIAAFSRERSVTTFTTLLTACFALLHRTTSQDDIVVGTPVANRQHSELHKLMGFFVNTLVLRLDCSGDPSFATLVDRTRKMVLAAMDHQDMPFERLVEEINPDRDMSRNPLYQFAFAYNAPQTRLDLPGVEMTPYPLRMSTARHDLEFFVRDLPDQIEVNVVYNTDLFDEATIVRMGDHFRLLLERAVAEPSLPLSQVPLVTAAERRQLLEEWNDTATDYPRDATVHALFREQARLSPTAPAVVYGSDVLAYAELDQRSDRLAAHLVQCGVAPGALVALWLERGCDMVVGILGILKAGAAYVPLDTDYPLQRIQLMLDDSGARVLLTRRDAARGLTGYDGGLVLLDGGREEWDTEQATLPDVPGSATDLAYVIYTSGSTGRPKGTCIPHRGITRLVLNTDFVQLTADDRIAQASNASFDAATFEIWGALLHGGCLIGIDKDTALSPTLMAAALREQRVSVLFVTTALFNQLVQDVPDIFSGLTYLLFGGEAVDPRRVARVLAEGPPKHLLHVYGPTECTTYSTWHTVREVPNGADTVPIGRPLANSTAYVLDEHRNPVPVGMPGELYLGGDGLARGYHEQPELTAERFVPHPFIHEPGARLYRSGDLVRQRDDGALLFVGRIDHQVKLRGFRIELGEIETALEQHPAIREAAVLCHQDPSGDKRLVAYVVPDQHVGAGGGDESGVREAATPQQLVANLREHLAGTLPGYMIPAGFTILEGMPLNANGKRDRAALASLACVPEERDHEYVAPRTETERRVSRIWSELLLKENVGVHDDFFKLGGHSLLAMQVVSRLQQEIDLDLSVQSLFAAPTVARFAETIDVTLWAASSSTSEMQSSSDQGSDDEDFEL